MRPTEMTLDALCAAMLTSCVRANRLLAAMPLPADALTGGPAWSDGPIPWRLFYSRQRLTLASAELLMTCYVRRLPAASPVVLSTRPPAWWQRLCRTHAALQLRLAVAEGVCTPRFALWTGVPLGRAPRVVAPLRLTLSPQQQTQLAELRLPTSATRRASGWLTRLLRWLRRLTGTVTN